MHEPGLGITEESSLTQRLRRVFYAPRDAFEPVAVDGGSWTDWLLPMTLLALIWSVSNWATLSIVADPELPRIQQELTQLDDETRATALQSLQMWREYGWFTTPFVNAFSELAAVGLILTGVIRFGLRAEVSLRQMLTVKSYAGVIAGLQWIVMVPLIRANASPDIALGLGALVPAGMEGTFFGHFLTSLNLFGLWQAWVIGIGVSVMTRVPQRRAVLTVVSLWLAWIAMGAMTHPVDPV